MFTVDCVKTNDYIPWLSDIFQFPSHGLLCKCSSISGKMGCGPMYVRTHTFTSYFIKLSFVAGLSGFALFVSVSSLLQSALMLTIPVIYEKYDKLVRAARALKEVRVAFILTGAGVAFTLLIA